MTNTLTLPARSKGHIAWIKYGDSPREVILCDGDAYLANPLQTINQFGYRPGSFWCSESKMRRVIAAFETVEESA